MDGVTEILIDCHNHGPIKLQLWTFQMICLIGEGICRILNCTQSVSSMHKLCLNQKTINSFLLGNHHFEMLLLHFAVLFCRCTFRCKQFANNAFLISVAVFHCLFYIHLMMIMIFHIAIFLQCVIIYILKLFFLLVFE